ncbi:hypothetical protein PUN28_007253 [Cardiocondyla obscurior]|uniref:Uncharacterized protein n=1 Tax=Cardiocondyla obscurior TaxID=286306 RepID=A0AAW2G7G9_9HYME
MIRKETYVHQRFPLVAARPRRTSEKLKIVIGDEHISFITSKTGSLLDVNQQSRDPEDLRCFYYLVQDLKNLVFSLIGLHFKIKSI